jgi:GT2 family glycosyltransferase
MRNGSVPMTTIAIVTYNRRDILAHCLKHLFRQEGVHWGEVELLISDDGSSDSTFEMIRSIETPCEVRFLWQADRGFRVGAARNVALRAARADTIIFLDADVLAGPNLVTRHLETMGASDISIGPAYGLSSGVPESDLALLRLPPHEDVLMRFSKAGGPERFPDGRCQHLIDCEYDIRSTGCPWLFLWGANFAVRRSLAVEVGGFDECITSHGSGDVEFGFRLWAHGGRFAFTEEAWGVHYPHAQDPASKSLSGQRNAHYFLEKHPCPDVELKYTLGGLGALRALPKEGMSHLPEVTRVSESLLDDINAAITGTELSRRLLIGGDPALMGRVGALVDPRKSMLLAFRSRFPALPTLWRYGLDLPFADGAFDVVLVNGFARLLSDTALSAMMTEARRVAPSGVVLLLGDDISVPGVVTRRRTEVEALLRELDFDVDARIHSKSWLVAARPSSTLGALDRGTVQKADPQPT